MLLMHFRNGSTSRASVHFRFILSPHRQSLLRPSKTSVSSPRLNRKIVLVAAAALVTGLMTSVTGAMADQCGGASWYGPGFHGKKTASGERFNENAMTAAHKTLPLGTIVKVTNQRTGKSIKVTINDRGPFAKGRIIDLSKAAAAKLGTKQAGVGKVCVAKI
jgi:rare lipoprotein A